jgi:hypothetical protein
MLLFKGTGEQKLKWVKSSTNRHVLFQCSAAGHPDKKNCKDPYSLNSKKEDFAYCKKLITGEISFYDLKSTFPLNLKISAVECI